MRAGSGAGAGAGAGAAARAACSILRFLRAAMLARAEPGGCASSWLGCLADVSASFAVRSMVSVSVFSLAGAEVGWAVVGSRSMGMAAAAVGGASSDMVDGFGWQQGRRKTL